jgi:hypothetical protein
MITAERLGERLPVVNPDDELGHLAAIFNETFTRLEQSFAQLRRFTAMRPAIAYSSHGDPQCW